MDDLSSAVTKLLIAFQAGLVTMVGGVIGHLIDVVLNGREWSLWGHLAIAAVAFLVGQFIGDVLPDWVAGKYGLMMMLGTVSAPLYKVIQQRLIKKFGDDDDEGGGAA